MTTVDEGAGSAPSSGSARAARWFGRLLVAGLVLILVPTIWTVAIEVEPELSQIMKLAGFALSLLFIGLTLKPRPTGLLSSRVPNLIWAFAFLCGAAVVLGSPRSELLDKVAEAIDAGDEVAYAGLLDEAEAIDGEPEGPIWRAVRAMTFPEEHLAWLREEHGNTRALLDAIRRDLPERLEAEEARILPDIEQAEAEAERLAAEQEARREAAEAEAAKRAEEQERLAELKAEQEERRKGFHCLSEWDGRHRGLANLVKAALREPPSFEHVETRIGPRGENGRHFVLMTYRARNGFGGMNVEQARAEISSESCEVVEIL